MTPERWREIQAVFQGAVRQPEAQRAGFVREACGDDAALREEVESLLRADATADALVDDSAERALGLVAPGSEPGQRVGAYRVVRALGAGGMGEVVLAERAEGGFEQRVAIKLIRPDAGSAAVVRRFTRERQILAGLSHPHVARLLDGGATEAGRPYFVMEYVDGVPIDRHCRDGGLDLPARLRLFRDVCGAVDYAHRAQVIHRDLKPDNILVTADGVVKLLDFGIARVVDPEDASVALTDPRQRVMTPQYAAPEQVRGDAVTAASDVYALGVLLYSLVADALPYSTTGVPPSRLAAFVCGATIRPPSQVAPGRGISAALDQACMRALAQDPAARFESAAALGAALVPAAKSSIRAFAIAAAILAAGVGGFLLGQC